MSTLKSKFSEEFRKIQQLGHGSAGTVWEAQHILTGKRYAVKIIPIFEEDDGKAIREAEAIASFKHHDNIVRYFHSWIEPTEHGLSTNTTISSNEEPVKYLYIQQELCQGRTLEDWLYPSGERRYRKITTPDHEKQLISQIVAAVKYIHKEGVMHRDLNPRNIFLAENETGSPECPALKLGDFGLVSTASRILTSGKMDQYRDDFFPRLLDSSMKLTDALGTDMYMSHEQYTDTYNHKVDIYALGIICLEILVPFQNEGERESTCSDIHEGSIPENIRQRFISDEEYNLIKTMTARDPDERPDIEVVSNWVGRHYFGATFDDSSTIWNNVQHSWPFIRKEGQVKIQGNQFQLENILPDDKRAGDVLSKLKGETLEELMVRGIPELFRQFKVPELSDRLPYISRYVYSNREVHINIFHDEYIGVRDEYIVSNVKFDKLQNMLKMLKKGKTVMKIANIESVLESENSNGRIHLWEPFEKSIALSELKNKQELFAASGRNFHFLAVWKGRLFWLFTSGSISSIKRYIIESRRDVPEIGESELLQCDEVQYFQPVLIAGETGVGKSSLLISLANQINASPTNTLVIFQSMNDLVQFKNNMHLGDLSSHFTKEHVLNFIMSSTPNMFEESFLKYCMQGRHQVTIHLMIDGLRDLGLVQNAIVLDALNSINRKLPGVQLWLTLDAEMQNQAEEKFGTLCFKISPLPQREQITFLQKYWRIKASTHSSDGPHFELLKRQAEDCIESNFYEICHPIHCRMLGEMYEDRVCNGENVAFTKLSLNLIYRSIIDKKLREYLMQIVCAQNISEDFFEINRNAMEHRHIHLAIQLLFPDCRSLSPNGMHFLKRIEFTPAMKKTIIDQGIVSDLLPVQFRDTILAEYFSALYFTRVITECIQVMPHNLEDFVGIVYSNVLAIAQRNDSSVGTKLMFKNLPKYKYSVLCNILNEMMHDENEWSSFANRSVSANLAVKNISVVGTAIIAAMHHNYYNIARILFASLGPEGTNKFLEINNDQVELMLGVLVKFADLKFLQHVYHLINDRHINATGKDFIISPSLLKFANNKEIHDFVSTKTKQKFGKKEQCSRKQERCRYRRGDRGRRFGERRRHEFIACSIL